MKSLEVIDQFESAAIHKDTVNQVKAALPPYGGLYKLSEAFKIFGDWTGIRKLCILFEAEMCFYDIACLLNMYLSSISHQFRLLKPSGLVKQRPDGKAVYYSMDDKHLKMIEQDLIRVKETCLFICFINYLKYILFQRSLKNVAAYNR